MYDGIALERHGIPAVVVCTELFEPTAKQMAAMQGVNDFPMVLIPHPLGRCPVDELEIKAERAVDAIAAYLCDYRAGHTPFADTDGPSVDEGVVSALAGVAASLDADGFTLDVDQVDGDRVHVALVATDQACHDCLVSDELMVQILEAAVRTVKPGARVTLERRNFT